VISFFGVRLVKLRKKSLKVDIKYDDLAGETEERLKDIVYLPIDYESDINEDEDD
jgi:hypothetical protein